MAQETTGARAPLPSEPGGTREGVRRLHHILVIAVMLVSITALHIYVGADQSRTLHSFYERLYYVPIVYAAFVFGLRGGLLAALASAALYSPYGHVGPMAVSTLSADDWLEFVMYLLVGGIFGRLIDVQNKRARDLRQVSLKLEDAYGALEDRAIQFAAIQEYTQSVLRSVTSGVVTITPDGSVGNLNPSAERILGLTEDDVVARSLRAVFKEDGGMSEDVRKVLEGRIPRTLRDVTLVTERGKVIHAQAAVSRLRDPVGRKLGAVLTLEDVSEVKALTEQLIRADRLAALGELTAGVAHEVRNPLGIIRASVQLMEEADCSRDRVASAAQVIKQEIDRLDSVIKALLDFGRPSKPTMRPVALQVVLEEVITFSRTFAGRAHVEIVERYEEDLPKVMADPEQLKQVIVNLVSNAVQAMEDGGTLSIETGHEDGFVFMRFSDTGRGIDPDVLPKVFDPFVSTRDDGTGLGLTIVHRIVDEHDGRVEVASEPGVGTAFTIWLPALQQ